MSAVRRLGWLALSMTGVVALLLLWWLGTDVLGSTSSALPPLSAVVEALRAPDALETALTDFWITTRSTAIALVLTLAVGVPCGAAMAFAPRYGQLCQPLLSFGMSLPNVAFIPVMILIFDFGTPSVIALGVVTGVPFVIANAQSAFERVDRDLVRTGAVYGGSMPRRFLRITFPGALPALASGTRIGAGRVLMGVVIGEMFGSNEGLGARLVYTANFFDMPGFYVAFLGLLVLGALISFGFQAMERRAELAFRMK